MKSTLSAGRSGIGRFDRSCEAVRTLARRRFADAARSGAWASVAGAALVVMVAVPLAAALNVWIDEAFTLHTTGAGPLYAWAQAVTFEAQPPLYFVLEALWRMGDETSVAFARLPSVIFAAAAVAVIVRFAGRITPRTPPLAVALVTAINPIVIWAAVEMRVYALVLLLGAALTAAFFEGFVAPDASRRARWWYVVFAVAGLYTQYYVGFVLAAHAITLLALRRDRLRAFAGVSAFAVVAFAPFARIAMRHVEASGQMVSRASLPRAVHEVANAVFVFVFPHDLSWSGPSKLAGIGAAALAVATLALAGRPALPAGPARAAVVQWIVCLAVFGGVFAGCGVPLEIVRHLIVVAPSTMLVAFVFTSAAARRQRWTSAVAAVVFTGFALTQLWSHYHSPAGKLGEWQRVAATLAAGDRSIPVAVFPAELALPLNVYLPVTAIAIPVPMPFTLDYVGATTLTGEPDVARVLDPVSQRSNRLWLVTAGACDGRPNAYDYHCGFLEAYIRRRYYLARRMAFNGAVARLLVRDLPIAQASPAYRNARHPNS
jgi:Dolichyl-phosphate-mannose-protein mannosyltransferase